MSGHAGTAEIEEARADGALRYFPKPVALRSLMKILAEMAQKDSCGTATGPGASRSKAGRTQSRGLYS
jgi:hypothetical protein